MNQLYMGFYGTFDTPSKAVGSMLMGADNLVGDEFSVEFRTENGRVVAWIRNKFDAEVGFFGVEESRKLQLANAREQRIRAVLSFVAYSDEPDPGHYWGEMAVFCFNPAYAKEMDAFVDRVRQKIADGVRPNIALQSDAVKRILEEPDWVPSETIPLPKKERGMAVLKDHQSISEKMIEQGRARNKGCYVVSWLFIAAIVLALAYAVFRIVGT